MQHIVPCDIPAQDADLQAAILRELQRVCAGGVFSSGPVVTAFEAEFARYCGVEHAVGVASGTAALHLAMRGLDVGPGDDVVTVPLSFIATVWAILYVGARPVFVDVDPTFLTLDPARLEAAITPRTKAIVPVHLYGQPADMAPILEIADRHGLPIVEDACQAHGARYVGRPAGSMGRIGCFSFYPTKNLGAYGEAGAVVTDDGALAARIRSLRDHGQTQKYCHAEVGYNYRIDALQAAVLQQKLPHLDRWNDCRRRNAAHYARRLAGLAAGRGLSLPVERPGGRHVFHQFVVRVERRDRIAELLADQGVATGKHYPIPIHLQPALGFLGHRSGDFPVSEQVARTGLSLPIHPVLTADELEAVCLRLAESIEASQPAIVLA